MYTIQKAAAIETEGHRHGIKLFTGRNITGEAKVID